MRAVNSGTPKHKRNRRGHATADLLSRNAKARKIEKILGLAQCETPLRMLEVGTGSGGIANYFGCHPLLQCEVDAVDVSDTRQVQDGFRFELVEDVALPFPDGEYDVVISNHVIEHVGDHMAQEEHLAELRRVIKPDGIGYLAVPNRWQIIEPHYKLAFLSWMPEKWRTPYVRAWGRGPDYDCRPLTVPELEPMLARAGFQFWQKHGSAVKIIYELEAPEAIIYQAFIRYLPDDFFRLFRRVFPTLIYILTSARYTSKADGAK